MVQKQSNRSESPKQKSSSKVIETCKCISNTECVIGSLVNTSGRNQKRWYKLKLNTAVQICSTNLCPEKKTRRHFMLFWHQLKCWFFYKRTKIVNKSFFPQSLSEKKNN